MLVVYLLVVVAQTKMLWRKLLPGVKVKMSNAWRIAVHQQAPIAKQEEKSTKKKRNKYVTKIFENFYPGLCDTRQHHKHHKKTQFPQ